MACGLSAYFAPGEADRFQHCFAIKGSTVLAADAGAAKSLLDVPALGALLARGAVRHPQARLFRSGERIPADLWTGDNDRADMAALWALLDKGVSLIVDDVGPLIPAILALEQAVERALGVSIHVNAYLTQGSGSAFAAHFDCHDVLIVQVAGAKEWTVFDPVEPPARSRADLGRPLPVPTDVAAVHPLVPGKMLYLPRGTWHRAAVTGEAGSLHLTVTIVSPSGSDYLRWLADRAAHDDALAADILRTDAGTNEALTGRLHTLIDRCGIDAFLADGDGVRMPIASGNPTRGWTPAPNDILAPALRRRWRGDANSDVRAAGQSHRLDRPMRQLLRVIEDQDGGLVWRDLRVADLTDKALVTAAQGLLAKGLIVVRVPS